MFENSNKNYKIILWSGGFDSTALLMGMIEKYKDDPNIEIQCVSIDCLNCGENKIKRETEARKRILNYIHNKYDVEIRNPIIRINYDNFNGSNDGLAQPLIWLFSSLPLIPDNSTIYPGYICGDDALSCTEDLFNIVKDVSNLQHKTINLNLDMRYVRKYEILIYLIKNHPDILDICTSCENPEVDDKCNLCVPCSHLKETLLQLIMSGSSEIAKVAYEKLKEWFGIDLINYIDLRVNHDDVAICNDDCDKQIDDTIKLSEVMIDD